MKGDFGYMEELRAFNYGANAVCFRKNGHNYGMICSWATQVDYDKIVMLLGAQSVTGSKISKGDIIGVSVLSTEQEDVMNALGKATLTERTSSEIWTIP